MRKKIIAHIAAGKPFRYHKYSFSKSNDVIIATPATETDSYYLRSHFINSINGKLSLFPDTSILDNLTKNPIVFINSGPFNARVKFLLKNVELLTDQYTPLN